MIRCPACGHDDPECAGCRIDWGARARAQELGSEPITAEVDGLLEGAPAP